jgi:hypothetical protein
MAGDLHQSPAGLIWRAIASETSFLRSRDCLHPVLGKASIYRSGSVKAGWIVASAVDGAAVVIGYLPAGLEPGRLGQFRSQLLNGNPT